MKESKPANKLIHETSPYLLQHAYNPVDWHPWGVEAMEKASRENKLIVVSIGYAACHWCHVMEHESFEDPGVAEIMNRHFVSIKVDREERPDVDHQFMTVLQLMGQQGGWPLNCVALPDGRPIWGGTYFPKEQWKDVLEQLAGLHRESSSKTEEYAQKLAEGIRQHSLLRPEVERTLPSKEETREIVSRWAKQWDRKEGGMAGAPKFPMPVTLDFLLHYGTMAEDGEALEYVELTLVKMARGGIYDQAGGGFARYSVDPRWKIPHFEKMLYDNGQLIGLYSDAFLAFRKPLFRQVTEQTIAFVQRDWVSPEKMFYSAFDADSEGEEGRYYTWKKEELQQIIGGDFELFADYYQVNEKGLWEHGRYILLRSQEPDEFASLHGLDPSLFRDQVSSWNSLLLEARAKRVSPLLDDKLLTSWNALMISGLVKAYRAFGNTGTLDLALGAARYLASRFRTDGGTLYRNYKGGRPSIPAFHIDYALFTEACLDLFEVTMDRQWWQLARDLTTICMDRFLDLSSGMFRFTGGEGGLLISDHLEEQDNVIPSSNGVMAHNLFRLGHLLGERTFLEKAGSMLEKMGGNFDSYPYGFARWGRLLLHTLYPYHELVVTGPDSTQYIKEITGDYLPHTLVAGSSGEEELPLFRNRVDPAKTRIFVCRDNVCRLPVENVNDAKRIYHPEKTE